MLKNTLFPAQTESEKIILVIRRHWFTYMIFWFVTFIMLVPLIAAVIITILNLNNLEQGVISLIVVGLSSYLLAMVGLIMYGFIDYYLDVYIITDIRIVDIKQNGFFKRIISELNIRQIQDVKARVNGIFPTLLHYGDVKIQTAGEKENFEFLSIPHPYETSKQIIDLHQESIKKTAIISAKKISKIVPK